MRKVKIKKIRKLPKGDRYDLTVPETSNFFANGILIHNTSQRTGYVKYDNRSWWQRLLRFEPSYQIVTGTRNVVKNPVNFNRNDLEGGYYSGTNFRKEAQNRVVKNGLKKDEVIYYEVAGFSGPNTPIMPDHKLKWSELKAAGFTKEEFEKLKENYGETVTYHYGCNKGEFDIRVYRITQNGVDLSDKEMRERCEELDLTPVEYLGTFNTNDDLMEISKELAEQHEEHQIREGVCLRLEDSEGKLLKIVKYKSFLFACLEGIQANSEKYVNLEEIS